ncbi:MAG: 4-(cytidine 5'-diphospho)-2-C-methyl-D-erythritol kinase [Leptonema sp. (in: bacteria)]
MYFTLFSNAKINLYLRVLYKRKDNYHQIESIFAPIPIYDIVIIKIENFQNFAQSIDDFTIKTKNVIRLKNKNSFEEVSERGDIKKNLIYQLLENLLNRRIQIPKMEIFLEKHIPPGSGVGGASSNAGFLLRFLIKQKFIDFSLGLHIANSIGSDVPFFLYNTLCYVTGRGEEITPLKNFLKERLYGILCLNSYSISTKEAYQKLGKSYKSHNSKTNLKLLKKNFLKNMINDFEEVAFQLEPNLKKIQEMFMHTNPKKVLLTGSGSGIFSLYENQQKMLEAYPKLKILEDTNFEFYPFVV